MRIAISTQNACATRPRLFTFLTLLALLGLYAAPLRAQVQTITFDAMTRGQVVDSVRADGGYGPIRVFGSNLTNTPAANAAVLFDSHCADGCTGSDPDLGSPNVKFGGPGEGFEGGRAPYANMTALGNVLIVHEYPKEIIPFGQGIHGVTDPDDEGGASTITLTFPEPVTMYSFTVIDRENNEYQNVELLDAQGARIGLFTTPVTGNNGVAVVRTDSGLEGTGTPGVLQIKMSHQGSGGLDNIMFAPPAPVEGGCTFALSYWKKNPDAWPLRQLSLGGMVYGKRTMLNIMVKNPKGDKSILLAEQLIAAHLNIANGADGSSIAQVMMLADQWLVAHGGIGKNQRKWDGAEWIMEALESYNVGASGPGACKVSKKHGAVASNSYSDVTGEVATAERALPATFSVDGNYPNPFNPTTSIRFSVPEATQVRLSVYDMLGREVSVLVDGSVAAGQHSATFDAADLPSGMYLYRLETPAGALTNLMTLLK